MKNAKSHIVIIIAFALPVLLIFGIALISYLPSALLSTEYDFVYATCDDEPNYHFGCGNYLNNIYAVEEGAITLREIDPEQDSDKDSIPDIKENFVTRLFFHDTQINVSREVTLKEVQALKLSSLITSPDGVSVESGYDRSGGAFFFFDGSSRSGFYLTEGSKRQRLNILDGDDRYYRDSFKFMGWVIE